MLKKSLILFCFCCLLLSFNTVKAKEELKGKILLQVESSGEAWYVLTDKLERVYLGRPWQAFEAMREYGLGIRSAELDLYLETTFPERLSGRIMLDVERNGEAYYIYPNDQKGYYLGRPYDAFNVMRNLGLGISNEDLISIPILGEKIIIPEEEIVEEEIEEEREEIIIDPDLEIPSYVNDLPTVLTQLSDSQKLVKFLNTNFTINDNPSLLAISPENTYQNKDGSALDLAVLSAFILEKNKYQAGFIKYQYQKDGELKDNVVLVFRDDDLPKYLTFDSLGVKMYHHGWSFRDLIKAEEARLGIAIERYGYFSAQARDFQELLPPYTWQELNNN